MPYNKHGIYSEKDDDFLSRNYPKHGPQWCADRMKRSPSSVRKRANRLGLRYEAPRETRVSVLSIVRRYQRVRLESIAEFAGISKPAARSQLYTLQKEGLVSCIGTGATASWVSDAFLKRQHSSEAFQELCAAFGIGRPPASYQGARRVYTPLQQEETEDEPV